MIKKIAILGIIVLFTLLFIYCTTDDSTIIGPFGNADKYLSVVSLSADKTTLYSNGDTSIVSIKVLGLNNSPASGLTVGFTAQFGIITEFAITDSSGIASALFISDENIGANVITIDAGVKKYTLAINIISYQPRYVELFSESSRILADGESFTIITAVLKDSVGNPMPDMTVNFTTSLGTLVPQVTPTNSDGVATTILTSVSTEGIATVTATSGISESINIEFYGPAYIELSASLLLLPADGISITDITVILKDSVGNPIPFMTVNFSTSLGTLIPEVVLTDENGMATTELTSTTEGIATVTAASGITKSIDIKFQNYVPAFIEISSGLPRLWADGESSTTITAVLKDSIGNPMPNMTVNFTRSLGTLSQQIELTDSDGKATTELTSSLVEGIAIVTATSYITDSVSVEFVPYVPSMIEISASPTTILADGLSSSTITVTPKDRDGLPMPNLNVLFSTNLGMFSDTTGRTNQEGLVTAVITSVGSFTDKTATIKVSVAEDTSIFEDIELIFRGIYSVTHIDSAKMSDEGIYKAYVRTNLREDNNGDSVSGVAVYFGPSVGTMIPAIVETDEQGTASSILEVNVLPTNQNNVTITSELSTAAVVSSRPEEFDIPGVEMLINTIDDEIMGDGEGWALVKATLREITGKAITGTNVEWSTTLGTIIGQSKTDTSGHTIGTLRIENAVNQNTNVTVTANYGDYVSISDVVTFIEPINSNRLILGFEPDTTGHGIISCNIDTALATREVGISASYVNQNGNPLNGQLIDFYVVPINFAYICPTDTTESGVANVMMVYPPQNGGEIVRVWGEAPDGTRGSIDVILPKDAVTIE